jgi:predicted enzyme related to lactoylglutathione lyase
MPRPVHFEIAADQPERAGRFYTEVFGWKVHKWEGSTDYWLVGTGQGPGIDGAIMRRGDALAPIVNTVDVPDLDASMERVRKSGGTTVTPRTAITGVGWYCYCRDTEGNPFGLMQADKNAK